MADFAYKDTRAVNYSLKSARNSIESALCTAVNLHSRHSIRALCRIRKESIFQCLRHICILSISLNICSLFEMEVVYTHHAHKARPLINISGNLVVTGGYVVVFILGSALVQLTLLFDSYLNLALILVRVFVKAVLSKIIISDILVCAAYTAYLLCYGCSGRINGILELSALIALKSDINSESCTSDKKCYRKCCDDCNCTSFSVLSFFSFQGNRLPTK